MADIPIWVIAIDYILGMLMWTLVGRFGMNIFLPVNSNFAFMKFFVKVTDPILKVFKPITPKFLLEPLVPLFVAWFFFIIRFYLMPLALGYTVMGVLSFPLEGEIAQMIEKLFN